jgi:hypothetical protein
MKHAASKKSRKRSSAIQQSDSKKLKKRTIPKRKVAAPREIPLQKLVVQAEAQYETFCSVGRDRFFKNVNVNTNVYAVLNVDAQPGARGQKPLVVLPITMNSVVDFGTFRRFRYILPASIEHAVKNHKTFVWIPIQLAPSDLGLATHSNAIHINIIERTIVLFEPHGCDSTLVEHGTFWKYYQSTLYFRTFQEMVASVLPDYTIVVPSDYQPKVFGQSKTDIKKILGSSHSAGDAWCVLWTCVFLKYTLCMTPLEFIQKIEKMSRMEVTHWITLELLTWGSWV